MNSNHPLVTCRIFGQMGNQLYQIAATLAYAWDYDAIPIFPELHKQEDRISYNRDRIFFRLDTSNPTRPFRNIFQESSFCSSKRVPFRVDQILCGYFQSWRHFHHHRDRILSILAPTQSIEQKLLNKYGDLINKPNTIAVHVRTFSKHLHENKLHPFIGFEYYQKALEFFPKDSELVVFSDRINWCKMNFVKEFDRKMTFIEGNDNVEDLFLMSKMKHNIIANSTFSWWGSYFNQNQNKIVVAPKYAPYFDSKFPLSDFYLNDWITLPVNVDSPYPVDMECYNDLFQSLNG